MKNLLIDKSKLLSNSELASFRGGGSWTITETWNGWDPVVWTCNAPTVEDCGTCTHTGSGCDQQEEPIQ